MKLLLDEHLSPKLAKRLQDLYPDSTQVELMGMKGTDDREIYRFALAHQYILVSKDADFYDLALAQDGPPKVVLLRVGNVTTRDVERILRNAAPVLGEFACSPDTWVCEIH